jgi:hypothetical protein
MTVEIGLKRQKNKGNIASSAKLGYENRQNTV